MTRSVELYHVRRGDQIEFMEFADMVTTSCQFLVFPAFRLQSIMKERFGGFLMWSYINRKLRSRDKDNYVLNEREKFMKRNEELMNQAI